ncbi:T9SS type A sorting domain-containing protein [bacterium]|nr:T9SS type A sorting domain-containing protein [bacterium]
MKRIVWFAALLTLLIAASAAMAQPWMEQFRGRSTEPTMQEIFDAFDAYWVDKTPAKGTGWKQFQRWRWFMETRLDENGNFDPTAQWRGWEQTQAMFTDNELDEANWLPLGPFDPIPGSYVGGLGRVNCMAQDPTNPNHMYAGAASGGLWETWTGGFSWVPLTDHLPVLGVSDIVIDHTNPSTLYLATGDADARDTYSIGILKSTDGGQTWNTTGLSYDVLDGERISRVFMDAQNNQMLIAATSNGIYKTVDGGDTWDNVYTVTNNFAHDLEYSASDPDTWFFAANGLGVYRSTDDGENWTPLTDGIPYQASNTGRINVEVADGAPDQVYALYSNSGNGFYGFYKSFDGGDTWSLMSNQPNLLGWDENGNDTGGQAWYDLTLAVNPQNANEVYVGGINVWKSTNGGTDWTLTGFWYYGPGPYVHADQHRHEFFIENNIPVLYNGNDGGLYRTVDGGDNWTKISHGMVVQQMYRLGVYQGSQDVEKIIFGNQDNGTKLMDGDDYYAVIGGDGMEAAIAPDNPDIMFGEVYYGDMRRSLNGGDSWQSATSGIAEQGRWVTPYVIDQNNPDVMWFGTNRIYRSMNRADSWAPMSPSAGGSSNDKMTALAVAPSNSDVVYGVNPNGEVLVTTDFGDSWEINTVGASPATYIAVHPFNEAIVYVTVGGYDSDEKVFASYDYGETWNTLSAGLPNLPVNCVALHPYDGNHVYIGTDVGVFFSDDGGLNWQNWSTGMPNVIVTELEFHANSNNLVAATYGRGIWMSEAEEVSTDPFITLTRPNGGEEWLIGEEQSINWGSFGIDGNVMITINRDYPSGDWETIFASTPNDYSETWTVTGPMTDNARVRITSVDNPSYTDGSDDAFTIVEPSITIIQPNGGEVLPLGMYTVFSWQSVAIEGNVALELNRDYPNGDWETIVPGFPDPGSIQWLANGAETVNARLRVRAIDLVGIEDISDGDFSILNTPAVAFQTPTSDVNWAIGEEHTITWQDNFDEDVLIELVPTGGGDPMLEAQTTSDGSFAWALTENATPGETYTIRISKVDDELVYADSPGILTAELMQPQSLDPADGSTVDNVPVEFSWDAVPGASGYFYELATGSGVEPGNVFQSGETSGTSFQVPDIENGEYSWHVLANDGGDYTGEYSEPANFNVLLTSVAETQFSGIPQEFELARVYPNPFNPETQIVIGLPANAELNVKVYNVNGQLVSTLADGSYNAGYQTFTLDGSRLTSGVYFLRVISPNNLDVTHKLTLVK